MSEQDEGIRLAKRVAAQQACSRSQAEALIVAGRVRVAGEMVSDPAHRVKASQTVAVSSVDVTSAKAGTVLLHKPAGTVAADALHQAWDDSVDGPLPRGLRECWPLADHASGLAVWSGDPAVWRRLAEGERPLEVEWLLALPMADAPGVLLQLQNQGLRASLSHEREGQGQWRVVGKGVTVACLPQNGADTAWRSALWRRQRLGRLGLAPLAPGELRWLRASEKF